MVTYWSLHYLLQGKETFLNCTTSVSYWSRNKEFLFHKGKFAENVTGII